MKSERREHQGTNLYTWLVPAGGLSIVLCAVVYLMTVRASAPYGNGSSLTRSSIIFQQQRILETQPLLCHTVPSGCPTSSGAFRILAEVQPLVNPADCAKTLSLTHVSGSNESDPTGSFLFKVACLWETVRNTPEGEIPKIIHQSWFPEGTSPRPAFQEWQKAWTRNHPQWKYVLWSDNDYNKLVKMFYPWLLDTFESFPREIQRSDAARYVYMHLFGGMYADMDYDSIRPMDPLLQGRKLEVVVGSMAGPERNDQYDYWQQEHNIPNAWMASTPGQQFWMFCLQQVIKTTAIKSGEHEKDWNYVESTTGPVLLYWAVKQYERRKMEPRITVLEPEVVFPIDWRNRTNDACRTEREGFSEAECKASLGDGVYALTYFSHSW